PEEVVDALEEAQVQVGNGCGHALAQFADELRERDDEATVVEGVSERIEIGQLAHALQRPCSGRGILQRAVDALRAGDCPDDKFELTIVGQYSRACTQMDILA